MDGIHIVDRLTLTHRAIQSGMEEIGRNKIADLIKDARDRIHELEGLAYSYHPQPDSPNGTTWRMEYENLIEALLTMTPKEFEQWQTDMKD
jgi:predicted RND superfamily exporter protein